MKKILISTGGSGGHVIPAITFLEHYKSKFDVSLVTDRRGAKYIDDAKYAFTIIDTPKISYNIFKIPFVIFFFLNSIIKSYFYLKRKNINYLISTGGYMSSPFCIAAKLLNIVIFLFEPNMVLGKSNKFFLSSSKKIICFSTKIRNFPNKYKNKIFLINSLIRKDLYISEKKKESKIDQPFTILIVGGSQGAKFFEETIKDLIANLVKQNEIYLIQQVFDNNQKIILSNKYNDINLKHEFFDFNNKLYKKLDQVDFAITRAGASTISELAFYNIPFLSIPFPYAKDNHQYYNAEYYFNKDLCWLVKQEDFDLIKMTYFLTNLIKNRQEYLIKKKNMEKYSNQNHWSNINQKLLGLINEY